MKRCSLTIKIIMGMIFLLICAISVAQTQMQEKYIRDFINDLQSENISIQKSFNYFGYNNEPEIAHIEKYCYLNSIDSCDSMTKEYLKNPKKHSSLFLLYLKEKYFENYEIEKIVIFKKNKSCTIYCVYGIRDNKKIVYYFRFGNIVHSERILNIFTECLTSILIG